MMGASSHTAFHSSVLPVGLPAGLVLAAVTFFALRMGSDLPTAQLLLIAKLVGGGANVLIGSAKNIAMIDPHSLVLIRPLSLWMTLVLIGGMAACQC